MSNQEISPAGIPILRHSPASEAQSSEQNKETLQRIQAHVEQYIGPLAGVFQEIVGGHVHVDIVIAEPTPARNYYTLVTSGMSNLPMTVPDGAEAYRYAELMLSLPADWPMGQEAFRQPANYWPIEWLKKLARLPHEYQTWLYAGHTIPNGDPMEAMAPGTKMSGVILYVPKLVPDIAGFSTLKLSADKEVHLFAVLPVYPEEMKLTLQKGGDALFDKLDKAGVTELLNPARPNVAKKRFGFF